MSSTRHAAAGSPLRQERWQSSPAYDRGLLAHLLANRCSKITSAADRELIWFLQALSWRESRVDGIAQEILSTYGDRIGTRAMRELKLMPKSVCKASAVQQIRAELPNDYTRRGKFLLRGEFTELEASYIRSEHEFEVGNPAAAEAARAQSQARPKSIAASAFFDVCSGAAQSDLARHISELCLNPESDPSQGAWFFADLPAVLRDFKAEHERAAAAAVAVTSSGARIYEAIEYTRDARCFTMVYGNCGRGKSFAARAWCAAHSGAARFVEVPASNDDHSFFLAIAESLGVSANIKSKSFELRERVEQSLSGGDILLCLDEAARLWPLKNLRDNTPSRVAWVMSLVDRGIPVALIVTPQFFESKDRIQKSCGWNSDQFFRRFRHVEEVPEEISADDLRIVCDSVLSSASADLRRAIVAAIQTLPQPLDTLDAIAKRAAVLAGKAQFGEPKDAQIAESFQFALRSQSTLARLTAPKKGRATRARVPGAAAPLPSRGRIAATPPRVSVLEFPDRESPDQALAKSG